MDPGNPFVTTLTDRETPLKVHLNSTTGVKRILRRDLILRELIDAMKGLQHDKEAINVALHLWASTHAVKAFHLSETRARERLRRAESNSSQGIVLKGKYNESHDRIAFLRKHGQKLFETVERLFMFIRPLENPPEQLPPKEPDTRSRQAGHARTTLKSLEAIRRRFFNLVKKNEQQISDVFLSLQIELASTQLYGSRKSIEQNG